MDKMAFVSSYLELYESGNLKKITEEVKRIVQKCTLCPHRCGVDRSADMSGFCRSGVFPVVSAWNAHFGEEAVLVGKNGSGTIFFTNCNLHCVYCQNYDISQLGYGKEISFDDLACIMVELQKRGCHNINFVTPTHMVYAILEALLIAVPMGLRIPLVYNTGGYDSVDTLRLLEGVFDIFMPDLKYSDAETGYELSGISDYPSVSQNAVREMYGQVGDLKTDSRGIAYRGILVRHLVLPNDRAGSKRVIDFCAGLSTNTYVNIMDQYRPAYRARECRDLGRRITRDEFAQTVQHALSMGLKRLDSVRT